MNPVLVVDDDLLNRDLLVRRLRKQGLQTVTAADGIEALAILQAQPIDLVLLDVLMPHMSGYEVLARMKASPALRDVPVLMLSGLSEIEGVVRCIEMGADDYLPKPFNPALLQARIGACLEKKRLVDGEHRAFQALKESQDALAMELAEAAQYVQSLLPPPVEGEVSIDWRFIPSTQLGGDALGYRWLDQDHLALYVLDVCGHGVGAALLSVSVLNILRSERACAADLRDPGVVLEMLNDAFPMERHHGRYFTIWYGVYDRRTRTLEYPTGGHPPAVLVTRDLGAERTALVQHPDPGMVIGAMPDMPYTKGELQIPAGSRLFVFSDGIYEVASRRGAMLSLEAFAGMLERTTTAGDPALDRVIGAVKAFQGSDTFSDDVSIMEVRFA